MQSTISTLVDQKTAEDEINRMYYRSGCTMEDTKTAILGALGVNSNVESDGWIGLSMAIERDESMGNIQTSSENKTEDDNMDTSNNANGEVVASCYKETVDGKGVILEQVIRAGEGPAHSTEHWTTVIVPPWAVGKSFYFQCKNNSPLDLSCELSLDGEKVAFNAPVQANSTRTIRPDSVRYYQRHQWVLNEATRVKLETVQNSLPRNNHDQTQQTQAIAPRYNGLRPDYAGQRISLEQYPDPTAYGWQFTGSVQESRVEFFEKQMNLGTVKMDLYYTTGTIKTVLHHPTGGKNQLFRAHVTPEQYVAILQNPRAHTGQGYRRREDRPAGNANGNNQGGDDEDDKFDRVPSDLKQLDSEMETEDGRGGEPGVRTTGTTYYARDNNYDFKRQGHRNRQEQMNKLHQSAGYAEWKEANKKEYAMIHAKFFVSIPKRMYRAPPKPSGGGQRKGKQMTPLPVPEQKSVVDIKAAENCTLGTKYHTTGPPQTMGRSRVRMERINGLTDDKASKGDAIFEQKLYYRAESIINGKGLNNDSDGEMNEDGDVEVNESIPNVPLAAYKTEKIEQVKQYHSDLSGTVVDEEEVEQILRNTVNKIHISESIQDVDESVNLFHKDLVHRQFESSSNINNNSMDC